MIEVPNFGSLRGCEREIVVLRSDNGETWREHTVEVTDEVVKDILGTNFDKEGIYNSETNKQYATFQLTPSRLRFFMFGFERVE